VWDEAVRILPDFPNFMVDSSSCSHWLKPERMKEIIRAYGANRVLFGTDYPMGRQEEEIEALLKLDLTDGEYRRIFRENATRMFEPY
jgi:predicted TIM-barrel fold metal-dependent hydrolase